MEQKTIREWNSNQYTAQEGADIIKELNDRTVSSQNGYNSIGELGQKVADLEQANGISRKDGYRWIRGDGNSGPDYQVGDEGIGVGTLFPGYVIHFYVNTSPMTDKLEHLTIISSTKL